MGTIRLSQCVVACCAWRPVAGSTGRRSLGATCLGFFCAILVSCGGELHLVPPPDPSPQVMPDSLSGAGATPGSTAVTTRFSKIVWATAMDPVTSAPSQTVTNYQPDAPRIIAALQAFALSAGSLVEATWEYNNTSLDAFTTRLVPDSSTAESWISFSIERGPDVLWPAGTYEVTVTLNGTTVQQASIEVTDVP